MEVLLQVPHFLMVLAILEDLEAELVKLVSQKEAKEMLVVILQSKVMMEEILLIRRQVMVLVAVEVHPK